MGICFEFADNKVGPEPALQMMVKFDSEKARTIGVHIWKKEEKYFFDKNCMYFGSMERMIQTK